MLPQTSIIPEGSHVGMRQVGSPKQPAPPQDWQQMRPLPQRMSPSTAQVSPAGRLMRHSLDSTQPRSASQTSKRPQVQAGCVQASGLATPQCEGPQTFSQVPPELVQRYSGVGMPSLSQPTSGTQPRRGSKLLRGPQSQTGMPTMQVAGTGRPQLRCTHSSAQKSQSPPVARQSWGTHPRCAAVHSAIVR